MHKLMIAAVALLLAAPAWADNPGKGKGRQAENRNAPLISVTIDAGDRAVMRDYFGAVMARGQCPPGLAKKGNGCQPPGQAKQWSKGKPLPQGVVFHDLPRDLLARLAPPAGARYVRVAGDILLIAVGTGLVLDALEDLSRL